MMAHLLPILAAILFLYIGNVLGNAILCENTPELNKAKKYIWLTPLFHVLFFLHIIAGKQDMNKVTLLYHYIRIPHKNIIICYAFAVAIKEVAAKKRQNPEWNIVKKGKRHFWENSVTNYSYTIMNMPQS